MKIAVIGTGYVGLVTGTCFAETGNHVICVDIDQEKLAKLRAGTVTIYEPGLEVLFERNIKEGRLHFTDNLRQAVEHAQIIFLALPTPPQEDGSADLQYVLNVAADIAPLMNGYKVLVNKSTVPVGTADRVRAIVNPLAAAEFDVVSNPEFLREGAAVEDFMKPERVVVGTRSPRARALMEELYKPFVMSGNPVIFMDERSSELTKYAANSFLATKISFMNEVAQLCERVGADVDQVRRGIGTDSRIGKRFIFAGVGYGGSCFPKDVKALNYTALEHDYTFRILQSVLEVNRVQKDLLISKIKAFFGHDLRGKRLALWGLAFKPNTDDIREAPALAIAADLIAAGAQLTAFDPVAMPLVQRYHPELALTYATGMYGATEQADALVIVTEWNEFRTPDFDQLATQLRHRAIFDGRNIYEPDHVAAHGLYYASIGRPFIDGRKLAANI